MISKVLKGISDHLIKSLPEVDSIKLSALTKDGESRKEGGIVITLLDIQEESSVKQQIPPYNGDFRKKNPEVLLNLYILISAQDENYITALQNISSVIKTFQANSVFSVTLDNREDSIEEFKLSLHSMSLEQNLSMWQTLGDRLMPSVVYKISVLSIQASEDVEIKPVQRIGLAYTRHSAANSNDIKEEGKKSSKDILGKGEDAVLTKDSSSSELRYLDDEERVDVNLPKANKTNK